MNQALIIGEGAASQSLRKSAIVKYSGQFRSQQQ